MMVAQHLRLDPYSFIFAICMSGTTIATDLYMDRILKIFGLPTVVYNPAQVYNPTSYKKEESREARKVRYIQKTKYLPTYLT